MLPLFLMHLFERSLCMKRLNTDKIKYTNKMITTRDIYTSDIVLIDVSIGQEIFFYVVKNKTTLAIKKSNIISLTVLEEMLLGNDYKVLSIGVNNIKGNGFKRECEEINKFIRKKGELQ